jgi:hypothetical protein
MLMRIPHLGAVASVVLVVLTLVRPAHVRGSSPGDIRPGLNIAAQLTGIAATSPQRAWAVGYADGAARPRIVIERWTAAGWNSMTVPGVTRGVLNSVTAVTARSAWAVGSTGNFESGNALILHWNGSRWAKVPSPATPTRYGDDLLGVTARGAGSAWAVGLARTGKGSSPLVLHWDGTAWSLVRSPRLKDSYLSSVTIASNKSTWAVGENEFNGNRPVLEHWNGRAWTIARSPVRGANDYLSSISAASSANVWTVGFDALPAPAALSARWRGSLWRNVPVPSAGQDGLESVTTLSDGTAWAAGATIVGQGGGLPLILRWNGHAWKRAPVPSVAGSLSSIDATSASNAWAVGDTSGGRSLILHWNGRTWT